MNKWLKIALITFCIGFFGFMFSVLFISYGRFCYDKGYNGGYDNGFRDGVKSSKQLTDQLKKMKK